MSPVEKIEGEVAELSAADLAAFRKWFAEFDANVWDSQFDADVADGKLDALADKALQDHSAGRSSRF